MDVAVRHREITKLLSGRIRIQPRAADFRAHTTKSKDPGVDRLASNPDSLYSS